jgi:hypothetical protein
LGRISDPVQASLEGSRLPVTPLRTPQPDYALSAAFSMTYEPHKLRWMLPRES